MESAATMSGMQIHNSPTAVPEFLCHSVHAHRRAAVEGLQARGAVRVPEDLRGDLTRVPACDASRVPPNCVANYCASWQTLGRRTIAQERLGGTRAGRVARACA